MGPHQYSPGQRPRNALSASDPQRSASRFCSPAPPLGGQRAGRDGQRAAPYGAPGPGFDANEFHLGVIEKTGEYLRRLSHHTQA